MRSVTPLLLVLGLVLGCPQPQTGACKKYVACEAGFDAAAHHDAKDTSAYGPDGACWKDAKTASQCSQECNEANAALQTAAQAGGLHVTACQ
jgi:hypothetical protein